MPHSHGHILFDGANSAVDFWTNHSHTLCDAASSTHQFWKPYDREQWLSSRPEGRHLVAKIQDKMSHFKTQGRRQYSSEQCEHLHCKPFHCKNYSVTIQDQDQEQAWWSSILFKNIVYLVEKHLAMIRICMILVLFFSPPTMLISIFFILSSRLRFTFLPWYCTCNLISLISLVS